MRYPQPDILRLIDTSAPRLYEETMRALSARDTALFVLSTIPELTTAEDLLRLRSERQRTGADSVPLPRTCAFLNDARDSFTATDDF
jgi:hypothetical protein